MTNTVLYRIQIYDNNSPRQILLDGNFEVDSTGKVVTFYDYIAPTVNIFKSDGFSGAAVDSTFNSSELHFTTRGIIISPFDTILNYVNTTPDLYNNLPQPIENPEYYIWYDNSSGNNLVSIYNSVPSGDYFDVTVPVTVIIGLAVSAGGGGSSQQPPGAPAVESPPAPLYLGPSIKVMPSYMDFAGVDVYVNRSVNTQTISQSIESLQNLAPIRGRFQYNNSDNSLVNEPITDFIYTNLISYQVFMTIVLTTNGMISVSSYSFNVFQSNYFPNVLSVVNRSTYGFSSDATNASFTIQHDGQLLLTTTDPSTWSNWGANGSDLTNMFWTIIPIA